jgi:SAM-dependent methyltransferase
VRLLRPLSTSRAGSALRRARQGSGSARDFGDVSPGLRAFIQELPHEREPILAFIRGAAAALPAGSRVLDAGAGDAPYRELFAHCEYVTADWPNSVHAGGRAADVLASLDDLPIEDASFDAAVSTQVVEHVPHPAAVLGELHRVLCTGGTLWLTAPLVWPLHEEPHDFFRYTEHGLRQLLDDAGFVQVEVRPRNGCLATLSQLTALCGHMLGVADDGRSEERRRVIEDLGRLSEQLGRLDGLDSRRILPLGYAARASRGS